MRLMRLLTPLLLFGLAQGVLPSTATASHFRYGHLTWKPIGNSTVEFRLVAAFRRGSYTTGNGRILVGPAAGDGRPAVGNVILEAQGPTLFEYGDGGGTPTLRFRVIAIDPPADWLLAVAIEPTHTDPATAPETITRTYAGAGPYDARVDRVARIAGLSNSSNTGYALRTTVYPQGVNSSPVSSLPPIVLLPTGLPAASFFVPAADTDPDSVLSWRLAATGFESGLSSHPPGISINPTNGLVTLDTTAKPVGSLWTTQVIVEDRHYTSGALQTSVPVDFIIQIIAAAPGDPPTCEVAPPSPQTIFVGQPFSMVATGATPNDNQFVTLNALNLPAGSTMTPTLPVSSTPAVGGSSVSSTFNWTPALAQAGAHVFTFTATDNFSRQHVCNVTLNVVANRPPVIVCTSPVVLWSPNHDLLDVRSAFSVSDPDNDPVTLSIRMFSNESEMPEPGDGTGRSAPDFKNELVPAGRGLLVRAERQGRGSGRWYVAVIEASDGRGGFATDVCLVAVVPHSQSQAALDGVMALAIAAQASIEAAVLINATLPIAGTTEHGAAAPLGPKQ